MNQVTEASQSAELYVADAEGQEIVEISRGEGTASRKEAAGYVMSGSKIVNFFLLRFCLPKDKLVFGKQT